MSVKEDTSARRSIIAGNVLLLLLLLLPLPLELLAPALTRLLTVACSIFR
jgi:hypothetical protein